MQVFITPSSLCLLFSPCVVCFITYFLTSSTTDSEDVACHKFIALLMFC